jgi:hypothetical protein
MVHPNRIAHWSQETQFVAHTRRIAFTTGAPAAAARYSDPSLYIDPFLLKRSPKLVHEPTFHDPVHQPIQVHKANAPSMRFALFFKPAAQTRFYVRIGVSVCHQHAFYTLRKLRQLR